MLNLHVVRRKRENQGTMDYHSSTPEPVMGTTLTAEITGKRGYAIRWHGSVRWVDSLLAKGLPHIKTSPRRVRICVAEADAWMRQQFLVQRRGPARPRAAKAATPEGVAQ